MFFCFDPDSKEIKVKLGEDVILPYQSPTEAEIKLIEWTKLDPGLSKVSDVFFYRDRNIQSNQHKNYQGRVELNQKDIKQGSFSVILKNVTTKDAGTYKFDVMETGDSDSDKQSTKIILTVQTGE